MCAVGLLAASVAVAIAFGAMLLARWQLYGPRGRSSPRVFATMFGAGVVAAGLLVVTWAGEC